MISHVIAFVLHAWGNRTQRAVFLRFRCPISFDSGRDVRTGDASVDYAIESPQEPKPSDTVQSLIVTRVFARECTKPNRQLS